jgi:hypothetical protein
MNELKRSHGKHFVTTVIFVSLVFGLPLSALLVEEMRTHTGAYMHPYLRHDVAVTNVIPSKAIVGQGYTVRINATVENQGDYTETFNVTARANTTIINQIQTTLTSRNSATITFTWNTINVTYGNYTMSAHAVPVPGETDTADNTLLDGWIAITIPGDINGDFQVGHKDLLLLASAYGSENGNPRYIPEADIDCTGKIDHKDLLILAANYGKRT